LTFNNQIDFLEKKICLDFVKLKERKKKSELPDLNWGPIGFYDKYPLQPTALPTELSSDINKTFFFKYL
jgi:hypothetical protein